MIFYYTGTIAVWSLLLYEPSNHTRCSVCFNFQRLATSSTAVQLYRTGICPEDYTKKDFM